MRLSFILLALCVGCTGETQIDLDALTSSERPSKRSEVGAVADEASNSIVIFGGNDGPVVDQRPKAVFRDDTWIFEPGVGWTALSVDGPSARGRYGTAYDAVNGRMFLFGGRWRVEGADGMEPYTVYNDLWSFDFANRTWTLLDDGVSGPDGRYYSGMGYNTDTDTLFMYGGATNESSTIISPSDELWSWNNGSWTEQSTSGSQPSTRTFTGALYDSKRARIAVFGGQVGDFLSPAHADSFAVELATGAWNELDSGNGFSQRFNARAEYDETGDRYLVFGGHADAGVENDLWAQNPDSGDWTELYDGDDFTGAGVGCDGNDSEIPADYVDQDVDGPERRQTPAMAVLHNRIWMFGGISDCSDHLDDTWSFDLENEVWLELLPSRSGLSCARKGEDCNCLCL